MNGRTGAASASTNLGGSSIVNTATIVVPGQQGTSHAVHITEAEPSAFAQYHVWIQSNPGSATSFPTSGANPFLLEPPKLNLFAPTTSSTFDQLAYPHRPGQAYWFPPPPNDIAVLADPLQTAEAKRDAAMRLALDVYLSTMTEAALGVILSRAGAAAARLTLEAEARTVGMGARGSWGGRTFDPANAGGAVRNLSTDGVRVTSKGVDVVEAHLARFGPDAANQGMVARLRDIAAGRLDASQADLNFYTHELREFVRYRRLGHKTGAGDDYDLWNNTHSATLADYGLVEGPGILYHPSVAP